MVRPTSETIIGASYAKWVQSYRDLPILINQWANVVRWEMRPRLFLRTTEFLWQEGHTVHETEAEAREETAADARCLREICAGPLCHSGFCRGEIGERTFSRGGPDLAIEAMVQDRKAIQAGTSHFLGQNFARASGIQFQSREGKQEFGWTTSWGMSTRMVGTVVMAHGDDDGIVLPPRIAPTQIVILPITPKEEMRARVLETCDSVALQLRGKHYVDAPIEVEVDKRELGGGIKNWEWIKKGVPMRVEIGPRDLEKSSVTISRRDQPVKAKETMSIQEFVATAPEILMSIQQNLYQRAGKFRDGTHPHDRKQGRILRFLYSKKSGETGNPRRVCPGSLERFARSRRTNQERPESDDPGDSVWDNRNQAAAFSRANQRGARDLGQIVLIGFEPGWHHPSY